MKGNIPLMTGLVIVVVIVAAILILFAPAPVSEGTCVSQCSEHTVGVIDYTMDAETICGSGCLIDKIEEGIAVPFTVTCKCCDCVGSSSAGKGQCNYPFGQIFNPLGEALGLCVN